ncbi:type II toxin-antitoxin system RelE/ParE family toxin [Mangrovivirga sp. M17]|uniref:Type II toxin-antitoxin system RelE/ParE family toxin n=1 Tax=Mangrovivirga halotolerans TaxID=2993936 RepID=A0ABT3RV57_9BACT|nr:type II toxin-antitoxin system RelE/ParE family toxin [Mangrovivirga halotolerans]MCX2745639.1 type II toxin-antitoxin system RelE/ParE family toxin [Mangrovivirga halotolerans]
MVEVIWTKKALGQLERAVKYIQNEQGTSYAKIVLNKILDSTELLENHLNIGTIEPLLKHKKSEYRFLVVWSYKIIYRMTKSKVVISRVFHTSRDPKKLKGI